MNIIEAIKSGKPYKRKQWGDFFKRETPDKFFSPDEVLADDWEIQEKTITITESQFDEAWKKRISVHFNCVGHINDKKDLTESIRDDFKKDMGF